MNFSVERQSEGLAVAHSVKALAQHAGGLGANSNPSFSHLATLPVWTQDGSGADASLWLLTAALPPALGSLGPPGHMGNITFSCPHGRIYTPTGF